jgi:hypothetical protein
MLQQPSLLFSQANWGMLEMKPHESKKQGQNKSEKEGEKQRTIKNQIKKGEKTIKRYVKKAKRGGKNT